MSLPFLLLKKPPADNDMLEGDKEGCFRIAEVYVDCEGAVLNVEYVELKEASLNVVETEIDGDEGKGGELSGI